MIVITSLGHVESKEMNTSKALPECPTLVHSKHSKNKNLLWENCRCLKKGERHLAPQAAGRLREGILEGRVVWGSGLCGSPALILS